MQRDSDKDKHGNSCDNCPLTPNPDQADSNNDGIGDACSKDRDADGTILALYILYIITFLLISMPRLC